MNIKALITTLFVVGSSSLALAQPAPAPQGIEARDHREYVAAPMPTPAPVQVQEHRWEHKPAFVTLSASDSIGRKGSDYIRIKPAAAIRTLKLEATSGSTKVSQIQIKFANGKSQVVYPNATINENNPTLTVDLDGNTRNVVAVTVFGSSRRGSFEILGA